MRAPECDGAGGSLAYIYLSRSLAKEDGVPGAVQAGRPKPEGPLQLRGQEGRRPENPGAARPIFQVSLRLLSLSPQVHRSRNRMGQGFRDLALRAEAEMC